MYSPGFTPKSFCFSPGFNQTGLEQVDGEVVQHRVAEGSSQGLDLSGNGGRDANGELHITDFLNLGRSEFGHRAPTCLARFQTVVTKYVLTRARRELDAHPPQARRASPNPSDSPAAPQNKPLPRNNNKGHVMPPNDDNHNYLERIKRNTDRVREATEAIERILKGRA